MDKRKKHGIVALNSLFTIPVLVCLFLTSCMDQNHLTSSTIQTPLTQGAAKTCNVKNYGAVGNGSMKDTAAIQKAIDDCAQGTGGIVEFPSGKFLTAPLFLKSNITLQVDSTATILGSQTFSDYTKQAQEKILTPIPALINGYQVNNITITGGGIIDGQGAPWWASGKGASDRPRLIMLAYINQLRVYNITLRNAGAMHLFFAYATNVMVDHVTITAPATSPNTDGIDPALAHNVTISNCYIDTGDDNIAIKSGHPQANYPSAGVSGMVIKNCVFGNGHGVSIGSETNGGVQNVLVTNSVFKGTNFGIRIKSMRGNGGDISHLIYSNLTMTNVKSPILFTTYYPHIPLSDSPQTFMDTTPYYHDITVSNLQATGAQTAGAIIGLPEKSLSHLLLENINITATTGLEVRNAAVGTCSTKITASKGTPFIVEPGGSMIPTSC